VKVETQKGAINAPKKEIGKLTKYQQAMAAKAKRKEQRTLQKQKEDLEKQKKRQEKMRILFTKDGVTFKSELCEDVRFNVLRAINDFKCEWIFTKKIEGKTRQYSRIGSDLNLICHVNSRLKVAGLKAIMPKVGTDYEAAKAKHFKECFLHPEFLEQLNVGQTKLIHDKIKCPLVEAPGKKRKRKDENLTPSKRVKITSVPGVRMKKEVATAPSSVSRSNSNTFPERSLLGLQNEGFELLQSLSTWMMKVSDAICVKNTKMKNLV